MTTPRALIAEDEPLLAAALQRELAHLWPTLQTAIVGDGVSAVARALTELPQIVFLDVRMPGQDGLAAAAQIAEEWPTSPQTPLPLIVFVTAYDQYALEAFSRAAVDYVQKPVQSARLQQTVARLQARLAECTVDDHSARSMPEEALLASLSSLLSSQLGGAQKAVAPLKFIQASQGQALHVVPVAQVLYFEAADKYVRVVTATAEHLVRTPMRELQAGLDSDEFWQIHRSTLVRASAIARVTRDEAGKLTVHLHGHPDQLAVSRLWAHRFKAM